VASKLQIENGVATCVWDDRFRPLLEALGVFEVRRASEVEFNPASGEWEATLISTGQLIAHGLNRNEVIANEVSWIEENLSHVSHGNR
jgi:hypothetical protein